MEKCPKLQWCLNLVTSFSHVGCEVRSKTPGSGLAEAFETSGFAAVGLRSQRSAVSPGKRPLETKSVYWVGGKEQGLMVKDKKILTHTHTQNLLIQCGDFPCYKALSQNPSDPLSFCSEQDKAAWQKSKVTTKEPFKISLMIALCVCVMQDSYFRTKMISKDMSRGEGKKYVFRREHNLKEQAKNRDNRETRSR